MPVVFLAAPQAKFQPVYVGDVAHCFARALDDDAHDRASATSCAVRRSTRCASSSRYVGEMTGAASGRSSGSGRRFRGCRRACSSSLPGKLMTRDNLASMSATTSATGRFRAVFGIAPAALEAIAPEYLAPAAIRSRFDPLPRTKRTR